ncbi:arginine methyl transferase [Dendrothele bispora CBS 962.96]|uniref:Arginine methyl transferase n=1 Tax=Dendrothele bispora (strain CBS 962.96) TaxID=1314807 RepID=A0A4S8M0Q9_DENBC|nr:arginine methyl transferase [Dendrothele bispora CBS 962.96]
MDSDSDSEVHVLTEAGELLISSILQGQPIESIKQLVKDGAPLWYQDGEGLSPLHAAAYMQDELLVKFLIDEGAVWNAVDNLKNTAGDIALSFNNEPIYILIRDAAIRSEMLLSLLSSRSSSEPPASSNLVIQNNDDTAAASTKVFLESKLKYVKDPQGQEICVVKAGDDEVGVMMGWEKNIMEETVKCLCDGHENSSNLKVLNIGFGLGIIDSLFQNLSTLPSVHYIVEPHPDVLQHMKDLGWYHKPGVKILEMTWQNAIDELLTVGGFDVVYTDTFSEDYNDLHQFFEHLPDLLAGPESRFSFFNGLGATNALFYDVYTHLSELHLSEVGVNVKWQDVRVDNDNTEKWGKTREYFTLPIYRLPLGQMVY